MDTLCQAGVPLVTAQGRGGGIAIAAGYRLNSTLLTQDELQAILAGVKSLDGLLATGHSQHLAEKLGAGKGQVLQADDLFLIDLANYYKDELAHKMALIREAVQKKLTLRFCYYYAKGESWREVEPYRLVFHWGSWYLYSWCLERQAFRLFKLNRLWQAIVTANAFTPRPVTPPELDLDAAADSPVELVARVEPKAKYRLVEEYGPGCYMQQPDGSLLFRHTFYDAGYMQSWLLGMGEEVTVLEPDWAAQAMVDHAKRILARYVKHDS